MAHTTLLPSRWYMAGFQTGRTNAVVAVRTTPAADLLHRMRKRRGDPCRLVMADTALLGRLDMACGLAGSRTAVMTGLAIRIRRRMRITSRRPSGKRFMAGVTLLVGLDMSRRLARGRRSVMAGRTSPRHHPTVIVTCRHPSRGLVALSAILDGCHVRCRLAGLAGAVVTGTA